jgi:uncharacterized protein
MTKLFLGIAIAALGIYLAVAISLYLFQRRLIYPADPTRNSPVEAGLDTVREVTLNAPDGAAIVAWYAPAQPNQPTLLYFHGNGSTLLGSAERIRRFLADGLGVFMPAYRGYSGSTGSPSETALIADAKLAHDHLLGIGLRPESIIIYGESLGTGVAVQLAADRQAGAVVLDAPYTSLTDIARRRYPFIPVTPFLRDTFASVDHVSRIDAPLLVMHGTRDSVIPLESGKALFEAAGEPKEMVALQGAGHSDIYAFGAMQIVRRFIDRHVRPVLAR